MSHSQPAFSPASTPAERYRERRARFGAAAEQLAGRSARVSNLRLLVFLAMLILFGWAAWGEAPLLWPLGLALLGGFVGLVVHHRRLEGVRRRAAGLAGLAAEAELRLTRRWSELPRRHTLEAGPEHPYAADLDLLGRASLLHLVDTVGTHLGERTLGRWLLGPAEPPTIRERQAAVAELAPLLDLRDELTWRGRQAGDERPDPAGFLAWAEDAPGLAGRRGLLWAARISPPLLWLTFAADQLGLLAYPFWLVPLLVNLALGSVLVGPARRTIEQVASVTGTFRAYAEALELLATTPFRSAALRRIQAALAGDGPAAPARLRRLHRLTTLAQPASSMLYPLIELATLWNVHVVALLEGWQSTNGPRLRGWLTALGEAEALAALASLAHDNPDWAFPTIDPAHRALAARGLGHPLLPAGARVANDVRVGPPGTFLLVTGSNMSGKSTLLRAIGLNAVLAQAGGPVCATELRMPPVALWTSMRVADSLERGVSYFMAELQRLKQIVDAACHARADGQPPGPILYLLDEILQGTNTAERQIAARRIIRLLLSRPAIGAVSTHDLTLADAADLAATACAVHLTESVTDGADGPRMTFDYRLRPGIARSTNALRLLELVGLPGE